MNSNGGVEGPWPDLAPPPEAVHLFHSYEDLKAQLLPLKSPKQQPQISGKLQSPADSPHETLSCEPSLTKASALQSPSLGPFGALRPSSQACSLSRDTATTHCAPTTGTSPTIFHRRDAGPTCGKERARGSRGSTSLPIAQGVLSEKIQGIHGITGRPETMSSQINEAAASPIFTYSSSLPLTTSFDEPKAQRRTRSSDAVGDLFVEDKSRRQASVCGREPFIDSSALQGEIPPEVECLLLRLQHRSYSTGTEAPFSWRRAKERAKAVAAAARGSSSTSCIATGGGWKFDGDMLVPEEAEKSKILRQEALQRVRQRAREARERQQQELLQQQLEQEQLQQRSEVLSKQLRRRTLQRIRENVLKQEEERQQQELLQQQMMRQAEVQRQYCARHRKALQQRLLQQQQEIKDKIRMHAEESVRQSRDAKARGAVSAYLICKLFLQMCVHMGTTIRVLFDKTSHGSEHIQI